MVAERAGVQRHTLYAHFPDERSLLLACSGLSLERDPLPDAAAWRTIEDRSERLRVGLRAVYDWYQRNAELAACVLRDAEHHALVARDLPRCGTARITRPFTTCSAPSSSAKQRAMLHLALSFFTWRTLVRESGLKQAAAVAAMVDAIEAAQS